MKPEIQLLYPLNRFYTRAGRPLPEAEAVEGAEVPEPYRRLLVHARDMTPTLEAFHGEQIYLRLVERTLEGDTLLRQVVLMLNDSARPVEYGAIAIHLEQFPLPARELILENRCPLGTILALHRIEHRSSPQAFLRVWPDALMNEALHVPEPQWLYGRRNMLTAPGDRVLADVLEILPPLQDAAVTG